jgi:amidase
MLDATHGPDAYAGFHLAPPERPYLEEVGRAPGRLRIGYTVRSPIGTEVHPEAIQAVEDAAVLLESLGHDVTMVEPELDGVAMAQDFLVVWFGQIAAAVADARLRLKVPNSGFERDTLAMARFGRVLRAGEYATAQERWGHYAVALAQFHSHHDLFMTPTVAQLPACIGEGRTPATQHAMLDVLAAFGLSRLAARLNSTRRLLLANLCRVPFTQLANVTGVPAMSVPLHWTGDGLPMGVQFIAPVSGEGLLFRLAGQLELAKPWFDRVPP